MKLTSHILPVLSFPVLALAHGTFPNYNRQVVAAASSAASSSSSSGSSTPTASSSPVPSGSSSSSSANLSTSSLPTFTLASQNPTAVPLSSILASASVAPTSALPPAFSAGSRPSNIPTAPGLPDISTLSPANYPPLDKPPPTDSPEVQAWIQEVAATGITIPDFTPNVVGGCSANAAAAADSSRCWWTCGGCTRGTDVTTCPNQYQWGLTYDDGPAAHTPDLLSYLSQTNLLATMFAVGSRVISFPTLSQEEYIRGHQIGVHTWSHYPLTTLSNEQIIAEFGWTKKVIYDVLGVTPTTMRPPYGDIDDRVRAICAAMNLTPVIWTRINATTTFDTGDFNINSGITPVQQVLANWENIMQNVESMNTGFIVLEHDLFLQSVEVATGYILPDALARKPALNITTVNTCLNRPPGDAYLETNNNATNPLPVVVAGGSLSSGSGSSKKNGAIAATIAKMNALVVVTATAMFGAVALTL